MTTRSFSISLLVLGPFLASGCFSRVHMGDHFGRAYHQAFERQIANPGAGETAKTPKGLDALEAGIVVETYRTQLAPKGASAASDQTILLSPYSAPMGYASPSAAPAPPK